MEIEHKYTVSELTRLIKLTLESNFTKVWVQGEISNFTRHSSGHFYFSLKDENAQVSAVMWRGKNLGLYFTPQDGMKVLAGGKITVFEKRGMYQLDVGSLQPLGIGELQIAFEQLKNRLYEEGLFDDVHKKLLPEFPERVGIVTSPTGAAIRDLVSISRRRYPGIQLILRPVRVQGEGAADEIARAIDEFNEYGDVDVLIIGRGGGSLEDLWAFNEEAVARSIFRSEIPVVSAVGHEVDFTIADFVADLRAPTPSAAAEIVVSNTEEVWNKICMRIRQIHKIAVDRIAFYDERIRRLENSHAFQAPVDLLKQSALQLDFLTDRMAMVFKSQFKSRTDTLTQLEKRLLSLSPENVLKRGYSITYKLPENKIVSSSAEVRSDDAVRIEFGAGSAEGTIHTVH